MSNGSFISLIQSPPQFRQATRNTLARDLLGTPNLARDPLIRRVFNNTQQHRVALGCAQRRERGREIDPPALFDQRQLVVI
jgi:hypothetical protein